MGLFMLAAGMYALEKVTDAISDSNINIRIGGDGGVPKTVTRPNGAGNITYEEQTVPASLTKRDDFSGVYGSTKQIKGEKRQITYKCPGCGASTVGIVGSKVKCLYCDSEHIIEEPKEKENIQHKTELKNNNYSQKQFEGVEENRVNTNNSVGMAPAMILGMGGMQGTQVHQQPQSKPNPLDALNQQIEQVKKLKELLELGAITQEEFETKKKQIMNL